MAVRQILAVPEKTARILGQVLKHSGREEQAFLVSLAGLILVLTWIMPYIYDLFMSIQNLFSL